MRHIIYLFIAEIVNNPGISLTEIKKKNQLNTTQLEYQISQANQLLADNHFTVINRQNKQLSLSLTYLELRKLKEELRIANQWVFERAERKNLLLLILFTHENISLQSLADTLFASKNTILSDLNELRKEFEETPTIINYSRKNGYQLLGNELTLRTIMSKVVMELLNGAFDEETLIEYSHLDQSKIQENKKKLVLLERQLDTHFSDKYAIYLPFVIELSIKRNQLSQQLSNEDQRELKAIVFEEDYEFISQELIKTGLYTNETDMCFVAIQVLSANVIRSHAMKEQNYLDAIIDEMIRSFEEDLILIISKKEALHRLLKQHLAPAIYRIKYGAPFEDEEEKRVMKELDLFYPIIKKNLKPLEKFAEIQFPVLEAMYVGLLFQSFLKQHHKQVLTGKNKAVVVCQNGLSISRLLIKTLGNMFPDIEFLANLSIRDYQQLEEEKKRHIDVVFSTTFIETNKKVFIIKQFLTEIDKKILIRNVTNYLNGYSQNKINIQQLLEIIEKNAKITEYEGLSRELKHYFEQVSPKMVEAVTEMKLTDVLTIDQIKFSKRKVSFNEAIQFAAEPLLRNGSIEKAYVKKIQTSYDPAYPYFVIAPGVAIPHASPSDGVNKIGLSLLKLEKPVYFSDKLPVQIILMVAPIDNTQHQKVLLSFYDFVNDKKNLAKLMEKNTKEEIFQCLKDV